MAYWSRYGITKDILKRYHVTSLKRYTSERSVEQPGVKRTFSIFPSAASPLFGYQFQESGGIKIYHPHSQVRFLYGGKLPDPYIFGKEQLNKSFARKKVVYITGGEKDVMSLASHGFDAVSFNSETYKLTPSDIQDLLKRYENVGLLYDSDETGIRESKTMLENFQDLPVFRVQLPLSGTKEEKDISDFFAMGHLSSELERLTRYALDDLKKKEQYQQTVI
jgi:5S rRNA maturation endonuclease (ribonuclease M5)